MRIGLKSHNILLAATIAVALIIGAGATAHRVRAAATAPPSADSLTLNPDQFQGETRDAYQVAKEHPELLAQLDCYCGCEQHEGHKNLLDCFRTNHGAGCDTCTGEAVAAAKLAEGGMPVEQIRQALHSQFAHGS